MFEKADLLTVLCRLLTHGESKVFFPPFQFVASLGKIFTMVAAGKSAKNVARESYSHKTNICEKISN